MVRTLFAQNRTRKLLAVGGAVLVLVLAGLIGFLLAQKPPATGQAGSAVATSAQTIARVDKLYKLPTGENPTVAQIKDVSKLADQPFYADAQNGDYLLVYNKAKRAFLYRESENRLINVAPISDSGQTAGAETTKQ